MEESVFRSENRFGKTVFQLITSVVTVHIGLTTDTLTHIYRNNATLRSLFEQVHQPRRMRRIAATICTHNDAAEFGRIEYMTDNVLFSPWKKSLWWLDERHRLDRDGGKCAEPQHRE